MTRLSPDERCQSCGSLLVPPSVLPDAVAPPSTDYVCIGCGRPYRWVGRPPRLATVVESSRRDDSGS
jgi:hypothetical protein